MSHVNFETAKRMKDAGFPQPEFGRETAFFVETDFGDPIAYNPGDTVFGRFSGIANKAIFAPTATDILRELPEYAIALHIDYRAEGGEAWFCWDTVDKAKTSPPPPPAWFFEQSHAKMSIGQSEILKLSPLPPPAG
ncbi:MAG: hypothetical protein IPK73_30725 [Candidatus Obscuribacter sp.]|nr:hypothetical protein [Candidatus Obscuribacter sp.]